ncbi:hypothetical protein MRBLMI12_003449 [Microbacterium sp. LMI12-1-1.1]|uniref:hypothetical protein n=1 Tax=unclassified Microbacterium TaxID=2609290 RepID=UPI0034126153
MGMLSKFRRRRAPYRAASEEERISRYVYLLGTLPASVIESAHASAFADVPPQRRREMFEQLRPFLAESERDAAAEDPTVIARLVRRAEEHRAARRAADDGTDAATRSAADPARTAVGVDESDPRDQVDVRNMLTSVGIMAIVANQFLLSTSVTMYYTMGAGSLLLGSEPAWVGETYDPGFTGFDGGGSGGFDGGGGAFDGGGFDAGGFGGGGFDGGGGFGG